MKLRLILPVLLGLAASALAGDTAAEARKLELAYAQKLDALLTKAKAEGDTASVKEIEGMIAKVEAEPKAAKATDSDPLAPMIGKWRRDYDNAIIEIIDAKTGVYAGDTPFTVEWDQKAKRAIITSKKWVDELSFTLNDDVLKGGEKSKRPYKLTRIK